MVFLPIINEGVVSKYPFTWDIGRQKKALKPGRRELQLCQLSYIYIFTLLISTQSAKSVDIPRIGIAVRS